MDLSQGASWVMVVVVVVMVMVVVVVMVVVGGRPSQTFAVPLTDTHQPV